MAQWNRVGNNKVATGEADAIERVFRRFADFPWSTRDSWSRSRRVVAKAVRMPGRGERSANPRFVVTSLEAGEIDARTLYERVYCARGDMENRIKECQLDLFADIGVPTQLAAWGGGRTSAATMRPNQLRLWFASMAYVLLSAARRGRDSRGIHLSLRVNHSSRQICLHGLVPGLAAARVDRRREHAFAKKFHVPDIFCIAAKINFPPCLTL